MYKLRAICLLVIFTICFGLINFIPGLPSAQANAINVADNLGVWKTFPSPDPYNFFSISMASSTDGWIVGNQGYSVSGWSIAPTIKRWNGSQWNTVTIPLPKTTNYSFDSVTVVDPNNVWVGGGYGGESAFSSTEGVIYHWNGSEWGTTYQSSRIFSIRRSPNGSLWAAGLFAHNLSSGFPVSCDSTAVLLSFDGVNWNGSVNSITGNSVAPGYHTISITPNNQIWVTSGAGIYQYDADGNNKQLYLPNNPTYRYFMAIDMVSESDGWAAGQGGMIQHWDGAAWTAVTSPTVQTIRSITMLSTQDGWAVGDAGTILHWDGSSWSLVTPPVTDNLYSISMISPNEGWIAGQNGAILHYMNFRQLFIPLITK